MADLGVTWHWGAGGVFGLLVGGIFRDMSGNYGMAFTISAGLSALGVLLTLLTKAPEKDSVAKRAPMPAGILLCPHCGDQIDLRLKVT